jgi:hypothetical protein
VLDNPAATLHAIEEAREDRRDLRKIRRDFFAVLNLLEEIDPARHHHVWRGCADYFADLPEARVHLTFDKEISVSKRQTPPVARTKVLPPVAIEPVVEAERPDRPVAAVRRG